MLCCRRSPVAGRPVALPVGAVVPVGAPVVLCCRRSPVAGRTVVLPVGAVVPVGAPVVLCCCRSPVAGRTVALPVGARHGAVRTDLPRGGAQAPEDVRRHGPAEGEAGSPAGGQGQACRGPSGLSSFKNIYTHAPSKPSSSSPLTTVTSTSMHLFHQVHYASRR